MLSAYLRVGAAMLGSVMGVIGIITDNNNEQNKNDIIEDLAERYNDLVESINNGTLDLESLEDVDVDDTEETDEDEESAYEAPETDDEPDIEYYPNNFINNCSALQNRIQNLYTDIESNNDYVSLEEDMLLTDLSGEVSMLCTAYQAKYSAGLKEYYELLLAKIPDIRRIRNYDSSVKENKRFLCAELEALITSAKKLNSKLHINIDNDDDTEDNENMVAPVYHKKGNVS